MIYTRNGSRNTTEFNIFCLDERNEILQRITILELCFLQTHEGNAISSPKKKNGKVIYFTTKGYHGCFLNPLVTYVFFFFNGKALGFFKNKNLGTSVNLNYRLKVFLGLTKSTNFV